MIVSVDKGYVGKVIDANGKKVPFCIKANTETGECKVYVTDENGKLVTDDYEIRKKTVFLPAPLLFVEE